MHPGVGRIHMTGSAATYAALVWGADRHQQARHAEGAPLLDKPFSTELGGVTPVIVVPGDRSAADLHRHAARVVFEKLFNVGHICCSPQILVLPQGWLGSGQVLDEIRQYLRSAPPLAPYYPGTKEKVARACGGGGSCETLPPDQRHLVTVLDHTGRHSLFEDEVFADVLGVVHLPAASGDDYLTEAVDFCNNRLTGTLAAELVLDRDTEQRHGLAAQAAIGALRYGTVAVNEWSARALGLAAAPTVWHLFQEADFRRVLGVPSDVDILALVPIGYPLGSFGPVRRRPTKDVTHWQRW